MPHRKHTLVLPSAPLASLLSTRVSTHIDSACGLCTGKFFWFTFIIFLTLNLMCFYGIMAVYITPDLIVATVLSAFFYGFWCGLRHNHFFLCMARH